MGLETAIFGTLLKTGLSMIMDRKKKPTTPKTAEAIEGEAAEESTERRRKRSRDQERYGKTKFAGATFGMSNLTRKVGGN